MYLNDFVLGALSNNTGSFKNVLGVFLTNVELPSVSGYGHGLLGYNAK
jgi:hypothetical protein